MQRRKNDQKRGSVENNDKSDSVQNLKGSRED